MRGPNKNTPVVSSHVLRWHEDFFGGSADFQAEVDSPAWFSWLNEPGNTTFYYDSVICEFTARREMRRGNYYWYAFKTANEHTYKVYLGPSHVLTATHLVSAAEQLYQKI